MRGQMAGSTRRVAILIGAAIAMAAPGCRSITVSSATGVVVATVGESVPAGLEPAYVVEIDGRLQSYAQRSFALAPGVHVIRAAPHVPGPTHQVPTQEAMIRHIRNDPLELDVRPGQVYRIALRVLVPPDYTTRTGYWQAVVASSHPASGGG